MCEDATRVAPGARRMFGARLLFFEIMWPGGFLAPGPKRFPVAIGEGKHPFPCRTRQLSPLPPMVLRGLLRGRVGHCRDFLPNVLCVAGLSLYIILLTLDFARSFCASADLFYTSDRSLIMPVLSPKCSNGSPSLSSSVSCKFVSGVPDGKRK